MDTAVEAELRKQIIAWVHQRAEANGGFVTRFELENYISPTGDQFRLIDKGRGIRNPQELASTMTILQSASGPYENIEDRRDGLLRYAYQKGDPDGGSNRKLRAAIETGMPIILLRKERDGIFTPIAPVYVVDDIPEERKFVIALDESFRYMGDVRHLGEDQRRYALRLAKQRLHQPAFRTRVLLAYETQCAVCQLKHGALLDAAHIAPDSAEHGIPITPNGLALCKIHHAAFDQNMLGISPDYVVHIDRDLLEEVDGPMLKHGLQEMHGRRLTLPARRADHPDRDLLSTRWRAFARTR